jgi:hypothetical protein
MAHLTADLPKTHHAEGLVPTRPTSVPITAAIGVMLIFID